MKTIQEEFPLLQQIMKGIAAHFGEQCEVVLHDYSRDYDHTIVAIENGHVTGRHVGDCGTNLGLEIMKGLNINGDQYNYITQTKGGKILRSTSMYFYDENKEMIGAMCINWDVSELIYSCNVLNKIANAEYPQQVKEIITTNVSDLLEAMIQDSVQYVGKPVVSMTKDEKIKGLKYLDKKGAFLIKRSADKVAKFYDISKNTLYNYLE